MKIFNRSEPLYQVFFLFLSLITLFNFLSNISKLRPIADDYCFANLALDGPIAGTYRQFLSWDGNYTVTILTILMVGLPLIHLGAEGGSLVSPIMLSSAIFGFSFVMVTKFARLRPSYALFSSITFLVSFLVYWTSLKPAAFIRANDMDGNFKLLSEGTIHWKTLQISYSFVFFLVLSASLISYRYLANNQGLLICFLMAITIGGSGYILATTALIIINLALVMKVGWSQIKNQIAFSFVLTSSIMVNFLAPGTQVRKRLLDSLLGETRDWSKTIEISLRYILSGIFSSSFLYAILIGAVISHLVHLNLNFSSILRNVFFVIVVLFFFTTVGNYFSGSSPWRYSHLLNVLWILGLAIGGLINPILRLKVAIPLFGLLISVLTLFAQLETNSSVSNRLEVWEAGPAPLAGMEDIEVDWVLKCAKSVGLDR